MFATLNLVAEKSGWGKPLPKGVGRGIATHFSFDSYVAQVVEASVEKNGNVKVHRVFCAVDCGRAINPEIVKSQMEGGIIFGLTAALTTATYADDKKVPKIRDMVREALTLGQASIRTDQHLIKYTRACFDMVSFDPQFEKLYLAAAAHLCGVWVKEQPEATIKERLFQGKKTNKS